MRYIAWLAFFAFTALAQDGSVVIRGAGSAPLTITARDLASMPRQTIALTGPDGAKEEYEGVLVIELLKKAGIASGKSLRGKALSTYVLAKAHDGYQVLYSLAELDPELTGGRFLVADKRNGKPLFDYQGPLRIVAGTDKEGARSIRMLEELEIVQLIK